MVKPRKTYHFFQLATAVLLILSLLWLTVSLPFVYSSQQKLAKQAESSNASSSHNGSEEETPNPFGTTTEEKAPGSTPSVSEEYVHDHHTSEYILSIASQFFVCQNSGIYNAFHGEIHVPPPNLS